MQKVFVKFFSTSTKHGWGRMPSIMLSMFLVAVGLTIAQSGSCSKCSVLIADHWRFGGGPPKQWH